MRNSKRSSRRNSKRSSRRNSKRSSRRNSKRSRVSTRYTKNKIKKNKTITQQLINNDDIKELFLQNCKNDIDKIVRSSNKSDNKKEMKFNKKEILNYCNCLSNKLNIKSLKNIDKEFFHKCIKNTKKSSKKRLTKYYTKRYKKSLNTNKIRKSKRNKKTNS